MIQTIRLLVTVSALLLCVLPITVVRSFAADLFTVSVDAGAYGVRSQGFSSISNAIDSMDSSNLLTVFNGTGFNPDTDPFSVSGIYRGLAANFSTSGASITMTIPSIGLTRTFTGATRDESVDQIKEWFKQDGASALDALFRKYAELTPIDPIAGNPNSIQARTVSTAFDRGFRRMASFAGGQQAAGTGSEKTSNANQISIPFKYSRTSGDYKSNSYTLPFAYIWRFDDDVRRQLSLDIPVSYTDVEGGVVVNLGLGAGYSHPLTNWWIVSAGLDYGATGSMDLGALGHVLTPSLTSLLSFPVGDSIKMHMGNMVCYTTTLPVHVGDYASNPEIKNTVVRNGLLFYLATGWLMAQTGVELFAIDTRYYGSKLYNDNYQEYGLSFGFDRVSYEQARRKDSSLRIGLSAIRATNNNGLTANFGYLF